MDTTKIIHQWRKQLEKIADHVMRDTNANFYNEFYRLGINASLKTAHEIAKQFLNDDVVDSYIVSADSQLINYILHNLFDFIEELKATIENSSQLSR